MTPDKQRSLERELESLIEQCKSDILACNDLDSSSRWSRVCHATDQAKRRAVNAVREYAAE